MDFNIELDIAITKVEASLAEAKRKISRDGKRLC